MQYFFLIILGLTLQITNTAIHHLDIEVERQCIQRCPLQNRTDVGHYDLGCGFECNIAQCAKGCKLWKRALRSSCQAVCNGTLERLAPKELYCVMGCNDAMTRYFAQLRARLGTPPAPALVADSLTATSLRLEWNFPEAQQAELSYLVQWRYEELAAAWQYCRNQSWGPQETVFVDNLQPYTKYRFRIALLLAHHSEPIVSAPSVVISTLPSGVPASPPAIVRAVPIDCTHISVSWEPGPFPHGPLLSYVIRITDNHPQGYSALKDIPAENNFYMFQNLIPARNYTVSIAMRNGIGPGPTAQVLVSTPPEPTVKDMQQPVLILGADHVVIKQGTDVLEEPTILYSTRHFIRGIALHISRELLFISDSAGYIRRMYLQESKSSDVTIVLSPSQISFAPQELSIDWLNDQLYILGESRMQDHKVWQVTRCGLDGRGITVAVAGLRNKPHHMEVDPYNGYLFWAVRDGHSKVGLYRLDLSDISNGIKHEVKPELILQDTNIGAFIVDHTNFRLLVSNQKQNTVNSVSLDGREINNIRPNIMKSRLQKVVSLAMANKKFYWTDGNDIFYEEYHPTYDSYFHNSYPDLTGRSSGSNVKIYSKVIINLPNSQPIPIPVNPPTSVQAIFGTNLAKTTWQVPHLLGGQGKGAWQNWSYEISIKDLRTNYIETYKNINITSYTIMNLEDNTEYIIKSAAYTNFGKGPWSSEFKGMTLKMPQDENYPAILWSAAEGLLKSDATGENVETLIHQSMMKDFHYTDVSWYKDQVYLVTNTSQVHWYNLSTHEQGQLLDIESVGSIAVDWIGKKLYWSNPKQQLIIRSNLNGTQQEPLPILTLAKELNIDAIQAYLYWSTGYAVECAHLNGADRLVYHPAQLFSGRQVMGLTLDMDHQFVYWIVRGSEGSNLYKAKMAGSSSNNNMNVERVSSLQKPNMQGPLCYFNNRLLWLQDNKNAAISDLNGKNVASISGKSMSGLTMVYVIDNTLHTWPVIDEMEAVSVTPEIIDINSVKVIGSWKTFNITWEPIKKVNFGIVFYEVKIDSSFKNDSTVITTVPSVQYWHEIAPFTKLHVTIRSFTYWATSPQVRIEVYSPPSTPSSPKNLRTYVTYKQNHNLEQEISCTFRWDPPTYSNGIIEGYKITCWYLENDEEISLCDEVLKTPKNKQWILNNLLENETYYFQVQAYTEIGDGELSTIASVNTSHQSPLPTLLISSEDSIFFQDIDTNENFSVIHGISKPVEMGYLIEENKVFWINEMQELFMFNLLNLNRSKIFDLNGNAIGLTVDWLARSLYYIQTKENMQGSSIYKLDLNHVDKGIIKSVQIFRTPSVICKIEVSPFTKKLYWTEADHNEQYQLMEYDIEETTIRPFFSEYYNKGQIEYGLCNCPLHPSIEKTFTLDHSDMNEKPLVVFIDSITHNIISSDKNGCICNIIADSSFITGTLPFKTLKSDFNSLYWTNLTQGLLYTFKKKQDKVLTKRQINAYDILIFGPHMQPYPPNKCLTPKQYKNLTVSLTGKTSHSLTFEMPKFTIHSDCLNISMATIEYRIYYMPYNEYDDLQCDATCTQVVTFEEIVTIDGLRPFSEYMFSVAITNYYINLNNEELFIGPAVVYKTAAGAPSKPQSVSAMVLNPTLAEVRWLPPKELNGAIVHYEIHWQTEGTISGIRQKGEQTMLEHETSFPNNGFKTYLHKLSPNETYLIWVRAYSEHNETSKDSDAIQIETFPEPYDITLINRTSSSLQIQWKLSSNIQNFSIQYAPITSNSWNYVDLEATGENNEIIGYIIDLKPKTQYKFRLSLIYPNYSDIYIWPMDGRFTYETLGDKPTRPGIPIIQHVKADVYQVWWEAAKENGAPIELYMLEGLKLPNYRNKRSTNRTAYFYTAPSIEEQEFEWESLYNGTENSWKIKGLSDQHKYAFRVLAKNSYGWSEPSGESTEFDLRAAAQLAEKQDPMSLILIAVLIPTAFCIFVIVCLICCRWRCRKEKKIKQVITKPRGPDVELATLRELPRRGNFIHNTNVLYLSQPTTDEITLLPHIRRDQITLMKFLGSGAFGEVFEGKAKCLGNSDADTKVAVKTLRKGASEQEKTEFLQEAQLMSHFKHEHILQLLGVCLDNDPHFIIMELMEGGDLLTYLRSSRNLTATSPPLTLLELLKMCVDVAKGCRYLEEMHFVHRDLACRNCLVSSADPETRIVKIGDFGLARDIYKNDYYRKEGEGLLPVRWMAPESLVDGVFTCQSDVWAFGVLLWEIMTLGQQPYPARNNLEVLHYVRRGGRLGKPVDCPEELHALMLKCWGFEPEKRPTFKYCLEVLENLHVQTSRSPVTGAHEGHYISTVPEQVDGVSNQTYFQDENYNDSGASWKSGSDVDSTPFLLPQTNQQEQNGPRDIPKYLELLYDDSDCPVDNDGYEIPRSNKKSTKVTETNTVPQTFSLVSDRNEPNENFSKEDKPYSTVKKETIVKT